MEFSVSLPTDEKGYTGRHCTSCNQYFKIVFGTGADTDTCNCPYCSNVDDYSNFITVDQQKYLDSIIEREIDKRVIKAMLKNLDNSFKSLEKQTKGGLIEIKVKTKNSFKYIPISYYQERKLETYLECDNCKLKFAIYGVFTQCPDCKELSAISIFLKSIESVKKRINLSIETEDEDLKESLLIDALSGTVSAFDGLGKAIQKKYNQRISNKKNLFQKLGLLSEEIEKTFGENISKIIGEENYKMMFKMFQVRHLYEHNFGEIDDDFIKKIPNYNDQLKRKYILKPDELFEFSETVETCGKKIIELFKNI